MQPVTKLSCCIGTTDASAKLGMEVWLDDDKIFDCEHVTQTFKIQHELLDTDGNHELRFILKNKLPDYTQIDDQGNIIKDARLTVTDLEFEEIELNQVFVDHAVYEHNFNNNGPHTSQKFYGEMGCNGIVKLQFSTPIYLWLLENM